MCQGPHGAFTYAESPLISKFMALKVLELDEMVLKSLEFVANFIFIIYYILFILLNNFVLFTMGIMAIIMGVRS